MIDTNTARNDNERLALELIRAMETGDLPGTIERICADDFVWTNSGFTTINGKAEFYAHLQAGGFAAEVPILELYAGGRLEFEFQRTMSRLQEMQSHEYLARSHRA